MILIRTERLHMEVHATTDGKTQVSRWFYTSSMKWENSNQNSKYITTNDSTSVVRLELSTAIYPDPVLPVLLPPLPFSNLQFHLRDFAPDLFSYVAWFIRACPILLL